MKKYIYAGVAAGAWVFGAFLHAEVETFGRALIYTLGGGCLVGFVYGFSKAMEEDHK